jgi:hypothetical protein
MPSKFSSRHVIVYHTDTGVLVRFSRHNQKTDQSHTYALVQKAHSEKTLELLDHLTYVANKVTVCFFNDGPIVTMGFYNYERS